MTFRAPHRTIGLRRATIAVVLVLGAATLGPMSVAHSHGGGLETGGACAACAASSSPAAPAPTMHLPAATPSWQPLPGTAPEPRAAAPRRLRTARAPPASDADR
jgi:hypothetical protein